MKRSIYLSGALAVLMSVGLTTSAVMAQPLTGNVEQSTYYYENMGGRLWGDVLTKNLTLEPGKFQFTLDDLGINDRLVLNLINPTDKPMRFETTQRVGEEQRIIVPANSTRVLSFIFNKPISDELEYLVMYEPQAALAAIQQPEPEPVAVQQIVVPQVVVPQVVEPVVLEPIPAPESQATVRGYW